MSLGDVVADRYRIDGVVGRGGFGAVYQATQLSSGRSVALKVLLKHFARGKKDSKRFEREAELVKRLRHPNVVALLDYGATGEGQPFIAFELLAGESLSSVLKERGPVPVERAAEIARGVLQALYAAHALGIIHRDIKPGNVFLCNDGQGTKVLDFGIAKAVTGEQANVTQLTEAGQMIGTPQYMAPEQIRGTGIYPATDLYALGLVMAEMLTGKKVVQSPALLDVYMQHIDDRPFVLGPEVGSSPLGWVIERAVAKVLDHRYRTAAEMVADLDLAVAPPPSAEPLSARTIEMPSRPGLEDPLEATAPWSEEPSPPFVHHAGTEVGGAPPGTLVMDRPAGLGGAPGFNALPDSGPEPPLAYGPAAVSTPVPSVGGDGRISSAGLGPESFGVGMSGMSADRASYPALIPSSPGLGPPTPSHPGAVAFPGSGEYRGLNEETYEDDYPPDSRAHFRSGLLIVLLVFVLAAVVMGLVWWAPWDEASAPRGPGVGRLADRQGVTVAWPWWA